MRTQTKFKEWYIQLFIMWQNYSKLHEIKTARLSDSKRPVSKTQWNTIAIKRSSNQRNKSYQVLTKLITIFVIILLHFFIWLLAFFSIMIILNLNQYFLIIVIIIIVYYIFRITIFVIILLLFKKMNKGKSLLCYGFYIFMVQIFIKSPQKS